MILDVILDLTDLIDVERSIVKSKSDGNQTTTNFQYYDSMWNVHIY